jgi:hypothetical protein
MFRCPLNSFFPSLAQPFQASVSTRPPALADRAFHATVLTARKKSGFKAGLEPT